MQEGRKRFSWIFVEVVSRHQWDPPTLVIETLIVFLAIAFSYPTSSSLFLGGSISLLAILGVIFCLGFQDYESLTLKISKESSKRVSWKNMQFPLAFFHFIFIIGFCLTSRNVNVCLIAMIALPLVYQRHSIKIIKNDHWAMSRYSFFVNKFIPQWQRISQDSFKEFRWRRFLTRSGWQGLHYILLWTVIFFGFWSIVNLQIESLLIAGSLLGIFYFYQAFLFLYRR